MVYFKHLKRCFFLLFATYSEKTLISVQTCRIFDYGFADMNIFCKFAPRNK